MAKKFSENYKRAWVGLYAFLYIPWFLYLEKHVTTDFHLIHVGLDDKIPFIEFFIVPYNHWILPVIWGKNRILSHDHIAV